MLGIIGKFEKTEKITLKLSYITSRLSLNKA